MSYMLAPNRTVGRLAWLSILVGMLFGVILTPVAGAIGFGSSQTNSILTESGAGQPPSTLGLGYSLTPSKTEPYAVCPPATKGHMECMAIAIPTPAARSQAKAEWLLGLAPEPPAEPSYEGTGKDGGFSPSELREAYNIHETGGSGQTVAIVDAYDDPNAEADLKVYRKEYKLSECTKVNGCFKKVNQEGKEEKYPTSKYPINETTGKIENWGLEISLDLDMVSAACPECKILLVEADTTENSNMYAAEDEAAKWEEATTKKKATEISNSWGEPEYPEETTADTHFNHEGIPITVAAGDRGYGVSYPAASKYVISVGGTELYKEKTETNPRGWKDRQWTSNGSTGSGCSAYEKKPKWQEDPACIENRTDNDTAAVAGPATPVSMYDSYETEGCTAERREKDLCWQLSGGTSVASPIVAAIDAHATEAAKKEGAEAFYRHGLFAVTSGGQGGCHTYLCIAEPGYNGPTGWGTPDGPLELAAGYHAITDAAAAVTPSSATLNGYVNPEGAETEYSFEYGKTTAYEDGKTTTKVGTGVLWKAASQTITGLEPNTTYHYRVVANNKTSGTSDGQDRTVVTSGFAEEALPKEPNGMSGVACQSQTCIAVGGSGVGTEGAALAETWNGSNWSAQSTAKPTGAESSRLSGVSCTLSEACTAVGQYINSSSVEVPLAERWNGKAWSIQATKTPTGAKGSSLSGVSCASAEACTAVGIYVTSTDVNVMFAEQWNGKEWSIQEPASPAGASETALLGVSCTSATACTAVGYYKNNASTNVTLAERWNGTEWSTQSTPNPASGKEGANNESNRLSGVSCTSATACTAVGSYFIVVGTPSKNDGTEYTLAEKWNGTEWSVQTTSNPGGTEDNDENVLSGVSCTSSTACTAVGAYQQGSGIGNLEVLGEHWNGTTWALVGVPGPSQPPRSWRESHLSAVSCTEPTVCVAVGNNIGALIHELASQTGIGEREPMSPSATTEAATAVTESGATLNGAVNPGGLETKYYFEYGETTAYGKKTAEASAGSGTGSVNESKTIVGLTPGTTYHFRIVATNGDGTAYGADGVFMTHPYWSLVSTLNPSGATKSSLKGTSCTSSSACTSVGAYTNALGQQVALAERWNGTEWTIQATPSVEDGNLAGISCTSSEACTAVGSAESPEETTLAERWNGKEWAVQSMPKTEAGAHLSGVSCASSTACTAVGINGERLLVEAWNGTAWAIQEAPSPPGATFFTEPKVSCTAASACTLAGAYETSSSEFLMVERWNGTKWAIETAPNPPETKVSILRGVACLSLEACMAVGEYESTSHKAALFAESWNGKEWVTQTVPSPSGKSSGNYLFGVSCISSAFCTAAGDSGEATLAEHWNGKEWLVQETPNPTGYLHDSLSGVSCISTTFCMAAGYYENSAKTDVTLAERYE
jgi:hypothetical protein